MTRRLSRRKTLLAATGLGAGLTLPTRKKDSGPMTQTPGGNPYQVAGDLYGRFIANPPDQKVVTLSQLGVGLSNTSWDLLTVDVDTLVTRVALHMTPGNIPNVRMLGITIFAQRPNSPRVPLDGYNGGLSQTTPTDTDIGNAPMSFEPNYPYYLPAGTKLTALSLSYWPAGATQNTWTWGVESYTAQATMYQPLSQKRTDPSIIY